MELEAPTLVTVLVRVMEFLRFGMVMEGRLIFKMDGSSMGHTVRFPVSLDIAVLL